jgi:hypothetical protein
MITILARQASLPRHEMTPQMAVIPLPAARGAAVWDYRLGQEHTPAHPVTRVGEVARDDQLLTTFRFEVSFDRASGDGPRGLDDGGFQEVSASKSKMDVAEYNEGGRNDGVIRRVGRCRSMTSSCRPMPPPTSPMSPSTVPRRRLITTALRSGARTVAPWSSGRTTCLLGMRPWYPLAGPMIPVTRLVSVSTSTRLTKACSTFRATGRIQSRKASLRVGSAPGRSCRLPDQGVGQLHRPHDDPDVIMTAPEPYKDPPPYPWRLRRIYQQDPHIYATEQTQAETETELGFGVDSCRCTSTANRQAAVASTWGAARAWTRRPAASADPASTSAHAARRAGTPASRSASNAIN